MRVSWCGDVYFDDLAADCTGSIRCQPIDMIYRLSRMFETPRSSTLQTKAIAPAGEVQHQYAVT